MVEMGQVQKSAMETRLVGICKGRMVARRPGTDERCAQVIVKIDLVESLLRPKNLEVSLRYVLKHANLRGQQYLSAFRHSRKFRITLLQAEDDDWKVRK